MLIVLLWVSACTSFDELQKDPNKATQAHPSLLLTNIEVQTFNVVDVGAMLASRMMVFTDGADLTQYYGWQRNSYYRYNNLRQLVKMDEEADRLGLDNYKFIGLFLKSVQILEITKVFGDVPYSESLSGTTTTPTYDEQQSIYLRALDDLKTANSGLDPDNGAIAGDVVYSGDLTKWKKLINSYSLRILMSLSSHEGNATLNVKGRFKEIVDDPATYPIFTSNDDNGALAFLDLVNNRYPSYNNNSFKTAYYMDESFVNLLKAKLDPRLFTFADKKPQGSALPDDDFNAYGGFDGSAPLADNTNRLVNGEGSRLDPRYYSDPVNEPSILMGYAELEFTLAEAAARGWTTPDDSEVHYLNAIHASMDFYNIPGADQDAYVAQPGVAYNSGSGIELIITQKYINYFLQGGWEAFFNHQRTGFPDFKVDGGGVLNNQQVPTRWMYPQDELTLNNANIDAAIARQFSAGDNINGVTWLLKTE